MQTDEFGKFIKKLMPRLAVDESIVALDIYKGLAASGTISVAALADRTGLEQTSDLNGSISLTAPI